MNFTEAYEHMKRGKTVKRGEPNWETFMKIEDNTIRYRDLLDGIESGWEDGSILLEDLEATDWEIVE